MQTTLIPSTSVTQVYSGPQTPKTTAAKNIRVVNNSVNAVTVTLWAGTTQDQSSVFVPARSIDAKGFIEETGLYLVTGESIWAQASIANSVNVLVYGPEN